MRSMCGAGAGCSAINYQSLRRPTPVVFRAARRCRRPPRLGARHRPPRRSGCRARGRGIRRGKLVKQRNCSGRPRGRGTDGFRGARGGTITPPLHDCQRAQHGRSCYHSHLHPRLGALRARAGLHFLFGPSRIRRGTLRPRQGLLPPTLTERPIRCFSDLRFTLTDIPGGLPTT